MWKMKEKKKKRDKAKMWKVEQWEENIASGGGKNERVGEEEGSVAAGRAAVGRRGNKGGVNVYPGPP